MQRILMVTQSPNKSAMNLNHVELFDFEKNPFAQFFARILLGCEKNVVQYFNAEYILWMHAEGSRCHGEGNDGPAAIIRNLKNNNFDLIILFGNKAQDLVINDKTFSNSILNQYATSNEQTELISISSFKTLMNNEMHMNESNVQSLAWFPHVSGLAQFAWIKNVKAYSQMAILTQKKYLKS